MSNMRDFAVGVYKGIDSMDVSRMAPFLSNDCTLFFGNADVIKGREAITAYIGGFFNTIAGIRHDIADVWSVGHDLILRMTVTYTRKDRKEMTFPAAVIWAVHDGLITDFRIYVDNSPLFAP